MRKWAWVGLCLLGNSVSLFAVEAPLTVLELFTSQGCYSCPPADSLLGELKTRPNTIAVACHVTYWNYLGWRDTFSREFCDDRQRHYQRNLKGNAGVYTPQMVINGRYGVVGSNTLQINNLIQRAATPAIATVVLAMGSPGVLTITLPSINQGPHTLLLLGTSGEHSLPIARGENGGKQLIYHNPVAVVIELGEWDGKQKIVEKSLPAQDDIREWLVLAQDTPTGAIVAAAKLAVSIN